MSKIVRSYVVDEETYIKFKQWCFKNNKKVSDAINEFMNTKIS